MWIYGFVAMWLSGPLPPQHTDSHPCTSPLLGDTRELGGHDGRDVAWPTWPGHSQLRWSHGLWNPKVRFRYFKVSEFQHFKPPNFEILGKLPSRKKLCGSHISCFVLGKCFGIVLVFCLESFCIKEGCQSPKEWSLCEDTNNTTNSPKIEWISFIEVLNHHWFTEEAKSLAGNRNTSLILPLWSPWSLKWFARLHYPRRTHF